jgi:N utilization substance protein A
VVKDQLSLAIGKRGQNVKLASRLTGWNLEIVTVEQDMATQEALKGALVEHAGASEEVAMAILGAGYTSLKDIADSVDAITAIEGVGEGLARSIIERLKEYLAAHPEAEKPVEVVEIEGVAEVAAEKEAEAAEPESAPADQPQETDTEDINLQAEPGEEQEPNGKD